MRPSKCKWLPLLAAIGLSAAAQAEPILLSGVLVQETESGKPYANLLVSAYAGVNSRSDSLGRFQMRFDERYKEQEGNLLVNYPDGWKVMFSVMLKYKLLPSTPENQVIACPVQRCDEMRKAFLTKKNLVIVDKRYLQKLAALKKKEGVKQEEFDQLQAELSKERVRAQDLAEQFARQAEGEISWLYRQAWDLYLQGELTQALEKLSEAALEQMEATEKQKQEDAQQTLLKSWLLRGELAVVDKDFVAAEKAYDTAVGLAPQSADAWFKFGNFHQSLHHVSQARKGYEEALTLYRQRAQSQPQVYLPNLADSLAALGELHMMEGKSSQAKPLLEEAIAIWQRFEDKNPGTFAKKIEYIQRRLTTN